MEPAVGEVDDWPRGYADCYHDEDDADAACLVAPGLGFDDP